MSSFSLSVIEHFTINKIIFLSCERVIVKHNHKQNFICEYGLFDYIDWHYIYFSERN